MSNSETVILTTKKLYFCPRCGQEVVTCEHCDGKLCNYQKTVCVLKDDAEHHHYHPQCKGKPEQ